MVVAEQRFTLSVRSENSPGVLHRITVMFTRRKLNIESLTVSETEDPRFSRFTIVVQTTREIAEKIARQLERIIEVSEARVYTREELMHSEVALVRIRGTISVEVEEQLRALGATLVHRHGGVDFLQIVGDQEKIHSVFALAQSVGFCQLVRSGTIALPIHDSAGSFLGPPPEGTGNTTEI